MKIKDICDIFSPKEDGTRFDIYHGRRYKMEKIVNDKEYPQQYTWLKFLSHVVVVFIMLFVIGQVIKTLSE